jgi:hypothetical protein
MKNPSEEKISILINLTDSQMKDAAKVRQVRHVHLNPTLFREALLSIHGYRANFFVAHGYLNQRGARRGLERQIAKAMAKERTK